MRNWVGPIGFLGGTLSLVFWLVVPFAGFAGRLSVGAGSTNEVVAIVFALLSLGGVAGALMAGGSTRLAPALMALAVVPGIAALLVPGILLMVAALMALREPDTVETAGGAGLR
jgi:hypothetical protein